MSFKVRLEEAKQKGYLIVRDNKHGKELVDAYYDWCKENQKPYIRVKVFRQYATVGYVMPRIGTKRAELSEAARLRIFSMFLWAKSKLPDSKQAEFAAEIDKSEGWIYPVPLVASVADKVAEFLAVIIGEDLATGGRQREVG